MLSSLSGSKLRVCALSKSFDYKDKRLIVLENIDLHLKANEFVCLVGASGCGKSTLLKVIAGLEKPSSGQILVDNDVVLGPGADRGMIFQSYTLFPWLSVADNIGFGSEIQKLSNSERKQKIAYYLEVVGLTRFADAYPKQLSGGMKQRVAIARALANNPEVLLMDEPFGALDAQTKEQMQQFMQQLWEQTQMTVLMVTHDVEEAIFLSQRIYVMGSQPGCIREEVQINLPQHRELGIKLDPNFIQIKRQIIHSLGHAFP